MDVIRSVDHQKRESYENASGVPEAVSGRGDKGVG